MWAWGEVLSGAEPFGNGRPTVNRGAGEHSPPGYVAVMRYNRNITAGSPAKPAPVRPWLAWLGIAWADLPKRWQVHLPPPPSLWERPAAASPCQSTYCSGRLNSIQLYYSVQYQNAQGRTRAGAGAIMRVEWRAGGISCVLLARAILYKVCPSGGMVRGASGWASFRTDQGGPARIAGGQLCGDQTFPLNLAFLFPDRLLYTLHNLIAMFCASIQSMLSV